MDRAIRVNALGLQLELVCVESVPPSTVREVLASWADAVAPSDGRVERISVAVGEQGVSNALVNVPTENQLGHVLATVATQRALSRRRGTHVLLHAAGIALEDGRVIAFVGPSGVGKTTLSGVLGKEYGYVSDETVAVSAEPGNFGSVLPYRKPLSIVRDNAPKQLVAPGELGLQQLPEAPLRIARVVLLERVESVGQVRATVEQLDFAESLVLLAPHLSYLTTLTEPLGVLGRLVDETGGVARIRYEEASQVLDAVGDLLVGVAIDGDYSFGRVGRRADADGTRTGSEGASGAEKTPAWIASTGVDWLDTGDAVVTLHHDQVRLLAGIAPVLWRRSLSLPEPRIDDYVAAAISEVEVPETIDADRAVADSVARFVADGLLTEV